MNIQVYIPCVFF